MLNMTQSPANFHVCMRLKSCSLAYWRWHVAAPLENSENYSANSEIDKITFKSNIQWTRVSESCYLNFIRVRRWALLKSQIRYWLW